MTPAFDAAFPSAVLETFTAVVPESPPNTWDYGPFKITSEYNNLSGSQAGSFRGNKPTSVRADVIVFDRSLNAWGAILDTQVGGNDVGIAVNVAFQLLSGSSLVFVGTVGAGSDPNTAFIGFRSDTAFDTIRLTSVAPGADGYTIDNMRYQVPEPASIALFGAGLAGIGAALRRRRAR